MDENILRLPSGPSSESRNGGVSQAQNFHFQHCSPTSYGLISDNNIGRSAPAASIPQFSQFLPTTSTSGQSLPPPPGLSHPGLSNIYQFPQTHCHPSNYQGMHYTHDVAAAPAPRNSPPLTEHFTHAQRCSVNAKATSGHFNGLNNQNCLLPGYSSYPSYLGQAAQQHPQCITSQPDNSSVMNQQNLCASLNKASYDEASYQRMQHMASVSGFKDGLNLLTGYKNPSYAYDDGIESEEFLQAPIHSSLLHEANSNGNNASYIASKNEGVGANGVGRVMNPIIENLMGSMAMCNGTYTHFGPTTGSKGLNDQTDLSAPDIDFYIKPNTQVAQKTLFSKVAVTTVNQDKRESELGSSPSATLECLSKHEPYRQNSLIPEQGNHSETKQTNSKVVNSNFVGASSEIVQQRSASPKDSGDSRPQTPGKPSYLEVLTKAAAAKNNGNSPSRKTSSTSSSPVQSAFSANSENGPSLAHRKSVDIFMGSASTPSSSCPSTSSSPATKQRNPGLISKGKENVSSSTGNKRHSIADRSSPSNSPSHQVPSQFQSKKTPGPNSTVAVDDRKVLSTQNNTSKNNKTSKSGKTFAEKSNSFEDIKCEEEWGGWRTYTSRSRNNNVNIVGNKNSQKRNSSGHSSSDSGTQHLRDLEDEDDEDRNGNDDEDLDEIKQSENEDIIPEKKSGFSSFSSGGLLTSTHVRKQKEKEKSRSRKYDRICSTRRRIKGLIYLWLTHMISALSWLWSLVTDVASLSASLALSLMHDFYSWTKTQALPNVTGTLMYWKKTFMDACRENWRSCTARITFYFSKEDKKGHENTNPGPGVGFDKNILSLLGPERNISLPANGDEALKRLLSVKGQDPYSILGVRSDSNDETIRRYYKRQAVLVHPDKNLIVGAEEAFKILARAFEMVGDPIKRNEYHQKLMEAQAKEKFCGEIGNLLEQLRKKMEAASSTIRCTKCNSRHKKNITDRPLFAARYCSQCRIHHGAREGELWAERKGWFGITWNYFACMDGHVWEINEWARCQKANLKHIKADAHCVMYRLVAGGNNHNQNHNQHCHGNGPSCDDGAGSEADEWDSLINNLYKSPGSSYGKPNGTSGKPGCCSNGNLNNNQSSSGTQSTAKRRKGKRTK